MKRAHMTVAQMKDHVHALAKAFRIVLVLEKNIPREVGGALVIDTPRFKDVKVVVANDITDETGYAIVLHEIGHHVAPLGMVRPALPPHPSSVEIKRYANLMLDEEHAAWDWAEHYALIWSAAMETVRRIGVESYEEEVRKLR